jgi:hypothetical protein
MIGVSCSAGSKPLDGTHPSESADRKAGMTGMWRSRPEAPDPDLAMDSFPKSLPISAPDVIDAKAEAELTRLLYRTAGFGLFSSFALAIILVAGTWTYVSPAPRLAWLTAILVVSLARLALHASFAPGPA